MLSKSKRKLDTSSIENFGQLLAFDDLNNVSFDLYCYPGHPKDIHDKYGALAVNEFYNLIISKLESYNTTVYRASVCVFAIPYDNNNPAAISIKYKSKTYILNRRTVTINNIH